MIIIYKITNIKNNKVYIGQTIDFRERVRQHKQIPFRHNSKEKDKPLYKAMRKYGIESFRFEKIYKCKTFDEANFKEIELIKEYNSCVDSGGGYNLDLGGKNGNKSALTKSKISEAHKGYGGGSFGKRKGEAYRARRVVCLETKKEYNSLMECAEDVYGLNYSKTDLLKIGTCANPNSNRFSHKGFTFRYLDDNNNIIEKISKPLSKGEFNKGMKIIELKTGLVFEKISECSKYFGISSNMIRDRVYGRVVCKKYNFIKYESFIANGGTLTENADGNPVPSL